MKTMLQHAKAFSGFSVDDLQKAKFFYGEILQLEVVDSPMGLLELHPEGGNKIIIYPKPNHTAATFTILNFLVEDMESAVDEMVAKGISFEQYGAPFNTNEKGISRVPKGPTIAWFKDPAGNILSVIEQ
jgi:predicted enzyme related to lactoylglutathione lyase